MIGGVDARLGNEECLDVCRQTLGAERDEFELEWSQQKHPRSEGVRKSIIRSLPVLFVVACSLQPSRIATARVQPAEARSIFTGKQDTMKPVDGSCSRLCSFSMWQ